MTPFSVGTAVRERFRQMLGDLVQFDVPAARLTSFRVGGPVAVLASPGTLDQLQRVIRESRAHDLPFQVLGGGTNLLISDHGFPGVLVSLTHGWAWLAPPVPGPSGTVWLKAGAGASLGGAIRGNAGAGNQAVGDRLAALQVLSAKGELVPVDPAELDFGYRRLRWPDALAPAGRRPVILEATFQLTPHDPGDLKRQAREIICTRRAGQPYQWPSAGCVFKNPGGALSAGALVEQAGLKGQWSGGAQVSERHANFIINRRNATASDIWSLIRRIQRQVQARFDQQLETEIVMLGRFD